MNTFTYTNSVTAISESQLQGLPVGWPKPPAAKTLLKSLAAMNARMLAVDESTGQLAGYACGMTDGFLILYIWDVEVCPKYANQGLELELLRRLIESVGVIYQINANPDSRLRPIYEQLGFVAYRPEQAAAMTKMRMDLQDGGARA